MLQNITDNLTLYILLIQGGALLQRIVLSANSALRELYSPALTNTALRLALFAEYSSRIK